MLLANAQARQGPTTWVFPGNAEHPSLIPQAVFLFFCSLRPKMGKFTVSLVNGRTFTMNIVEYKNESFKDPDRKDYLDSGKSNMPSTAMNKINNTI